jgi:hypothetical protein
MLREVWLSACPCLLSIPRPEITCGILGTCDAPMGVCARKIKSIQDRVSESCQPKPLLININRSLKATREIRTINSHEEKVPSSSLGGGSSVKKLTQETERNS